MKTRYQLVLFDLDGTLTDSGPGIISCVKKTLEHMGSPIPAQDILRRFIGPPLWSSFSRLAGMSEKETGEAVQYFREIYNHDGIFDNSLYDGMLELLRELRQAGATLAVATSKTRSMAKTVLDYFKLSPVFPIVSAADEKERARGKEELILPVLKKTGCAPGDAVMIGDTKFDAAGARKAGVNFIGVLYGFGTEEEMRREGAENFAPEVKDLYNLLIDKR